ncbi:MAG: ACP S-malonyltransferase [Spirochaetia bacterium]|nr:ACP S-malonyltransferase [Spirochaetia bacterium]
MKKSVIFPGQGAQRPTMGKDYYDEFQIAREIYDKASEAIQEDIKKICFEEDDRLNLTEYTQPCILTTEIAMLEVIKKEFGFNPEIYAGHSLGEYTALTAAGVMPFESAVKIVKKRGSLMQSAVPEGKGTMAALIADNIPIDIVKNSCDSNSITMANINSKSQIVISGGVEETKKTCEELEKKIEGLGVIYLNVSAPFHSSLMRGIEDEFKSVLNGFEEVFNKENSVHVLSNFTGTYHLPDTLIENLVRQISGSVKWLDNMSEIMNASNEIYEIGPNKPLGKFFKTVGGEVSSIINLRGARSTFEKKE